jgi:hypothetical protein
MTSRGARSCSFTHGISQRLTQFLDIQFSVVIGIRFVEHGIQATQLLRFCFTNGAVVIAVQLLHQLLRISGWLRHCVFASPTCDCA